VVLGRRVQGKNKKKREEGNDITKEEKRRKRPSQEHHKLEEDFTQAGGKLMLDGMFFNRPLTLQEGENNPLLGKEAKTTLQQK